jgi:hypothetical protein
MFPFSGPQKLPLLGGLTWFYKRKSLIHNIKDMVEDYGKICGVFIGSKPMVIIADLEMLKGKVDFNPALSGLVLSFEVFQCAN